MLQGWFIVVVALAYIGFLFLVASYGDRSRKRVRGSRARLLIYPLSLAIYCTSWTFFGSVGVAARTGFDFLTIYIGPVLMVGLAYPLIIRIVRLAKGQNITSIADFIAARYGKSQAVAATVALIAIVGMIPYIALQLKAVSASVGTIIANVAAGGGAVQPLLGDIALFVALLMAAFAVLFGTRHVDATEHQDGLMLAIATELIIKLVAFLAVGIFVTFVMFPGPVALFTRALDDPHTASVLTHVPSATTFLATTVLSLFAIVLLPRQFHVGVVENRSESEIRRAALLFPAYLVLINLFVMPIAMAGLLTFPLGLTDGDMFVLALPLRAHSELFTLIAFVGGLSAATAMVIVESVALAIMVSNDIVMPLILNRRAIAADGPDDAGAQLLMVRRLAIFAILFLAYIYYRSAGPAQLASIGLLSFAAIAQLMPVFFGGLVWRRGTALGAIAGMTAGILVWAYTLLLPSISDTGIIGEHIVGVGPLGIAWLRPQALFGLELPPLVHGVVLSLFANITLFVGCSLLGRPSAIERMQADLFVPSSLAPMAPSFRLRRASVTVEELIATVTRYLGEERTRESFASFAASKRLSLEPQAEADFQLLQYGEYLLASAIGAASSRLVLSLLLRKRNVSTKAALKLLDDANAAIHYNREILQTALDHVRQGIAVFDKELALVCWNRQFGELFDLPHGLTRVGTPLDEILRHIAQNGGRDGRGVTADGKDFDAQIAERVRKYRSEAEPFLERFADRGLVIEVRADRMPGGGLVTTFTDITPSVKSAEALERANATLERRVRERTRELTRLNSELERAKAEADDANVSKTRFIAAASHDILQPLNAARLYVTSLIERQRAGGDFGPGAQYRRLARSGGRDLRGAIGDIAARYRRHAAGDERLPHRRIAGTPRRRICAVGARQGADAEIHAVLAGGALRPALAAAAPAKSGLERDQIYAARHRADRLPPARSAAAHRRLRHRHWHSACQAPRRVQGIPSARSWRARRPRRRAGAVDRRAHRARTGSGSHDEIRLRPRLALFRRGAAGRRRGARGRAGADRAQIRHRPAHRHRGCLHRQRARDPRRHADAAGRLGLPRADRRKSRAGTGRTRRQRPRARRPVGRLSSRRRERRRRHQRIAPPLRPRSAGDPRHRRPLRACARGGARLRRPHPQQAGQAGLAACSDHTVARAARRGRVGCHSGLATRGGCCRLGISKYRSREHSRSGARPRMTRSPRGSRSDLLLKSPRG